MTASGNLGLLQSGESIGWRFPPRDSKGGTGTTHLRRGCCPLGRAANSCSANLERDWKLGTSCSWNVPKGPKSK